MARTARAGSFPSEIEFKILKERHSEYMEDFWARCRALYAGGPKLLEDDKVLCRIMPKHGSEHEDIYKERKKRAFYIPYAGSIVDKIVSELMSKPITFEPESGVDKDGDGEIEPSELSDDQSEQQLPPYYADLVKSCGKPGGARCDLNQFAREQIFTALQCQVAWALVDMPKAPKTGYKNLAEQDKARGRDAYICPIDPECVVDWEERDDGELEWVLIQDTIIKRNGLTGNRNTVTLRWRYFTDTDWAVYELTYDKAQRPNGPVDTDKAKLVDSGTHGFRRVPVRRLRLPDGLWAMGKLEAIARAHMNQRNALSWGQLKALFPVPVLYAQAANPADPISEDAGRANQTHGVGYMRVLAEKDRLEYFSPDTAPYQIAAEDLSMLRDEMHRVLHHMAMSVDNSGAALQRSADSKAIDQAAASVILRALGIFVREHLEEILGLISVARGDNLRIAAKGMDSFEDVTLSALVQDAIGISTVSIPSAHFQKRFKFKIAKLALGADATEDDLRKISEELESGVTQDEFEAEAEARVFSHQAAIEDPSGVALPKGKGKGKGKSKR